MSLSIAIVGLGNFSKEYLSTRHNIGFWLIDQIAQHFSLDFKLNNKFNAWHCHIHQANNDLTTHLLKPNTYINLSGLPVKSFFDYYKHQLFAIKHKNKLLYDRLIVIHDDIDLPLGKIKIKFAGSSGGHNGIKDIDAKIGTIDYWRIRVGIGKPSIHAEQLVNKSHIITSHVLGVAREDEISIINKSFSKFILNIQDFLNIFSGPKDININHNHNEYILSNYDKQISKFLHKLT